MNDSGYYQDDSSRAKKVEQLFSKIAPRYNLINDIQSFGLHRVWKKKLLKLAEIRPGDFFLDLATGTGDLMRMGCSFCPQSRWVGIDFTYAMLRSGNMNAPLVQGDVLKLPLGDQIFSGATMAYGLRNIADRRQALSEIVRVLKPGGRFVFLDFAKPKGKILRSLYFGWLKMIQPVLGKVFFRDAETYRYIWRSLEAYPEVEEITQELKKAGFKEVKECRLFFGMMSIHLAYV